MAAAPTRKKKPPQKRRTEKQQQQQKKSTPKQAKCPPKPFVPKVLQKLGHGKLALHTEADKKATFTQQCVLTTQDGQQHCFLSNCITSRAAAGAPSAPPAPAWPPVARWVITCPPQLGAPSRPLWWDGRQQRGLSHAGPALALCGRTDRLLCILPTRNLPYEASETMSRQQLACLFPSPDPC